MSSVHDSEHDQNDDDEYVWVESPMMRMIREEQAHRETRLSAMGHVSDSDGVTKSTQRLLDTIKADRVQIEAIRQQADFIENNREAIANAQRTIDSVTQTACAADSAMHSWGLSAAIPPQHDLAERQKLADQMRLAQGWTRVRRKQRDYTPPQTAVTPIQPTPSQTSHECASPSVTSPSENPSPTPVKRKRGNPQIRPTLSKEDVDRLIRDYISEHGATPSLAVFAEFAGAQYRTVSERRITEYAKWYYGTNWPGVRNHYRCLLNLAS